MILFTKMHGLGNDFVVLDEITSTERSCKGTIPAEFPRDLAWRLCDRRFGVGCDQILRLILPRDARQAQVRMDIFNADGSIAEMCGNGIRAVGLYLHRYWKNEKEFRIETLAGLQIVTIEGNQVRVNMGIPTVAAKTEKLQFKGQIKNESKNETIEFWEVSTGNPHAVTFTSSVESVPLEEWGSVIERHARFPKRTNVEFVQVMSKSQIRVRVWERGAGITLACGTGACASAAAAQQAGLVGSSCEVILPGGSLQIEWKGGQEPLFMTGPAEEVFFGKFSY